MASLRFLTRLPQTQLHSPIALARRSFFSIQGLSQKTHKERKLLSCSQQEAYDIISNVNNYHQFLPFCTRSEVYTSKKIRQDVTVMKAELEVGFGMFQEKYMSEVTLEEPRVVKAVAADASVFKQMVTTWTIMPNIPEAKRNAQSRHAPSCLVEFDIKFEFASPLHAQAGNAFFHKVADLMMKAFTDQCEAVYKKPATLTR
ncbi:Coenzyme Q-binding protein COQ10 B, mitochondrial [Apophysomyces sp. BC1034]|nr:Coenzyme Q-binding protein COQ10 B, mitochondrial [Apophysomyces sp. BC1015]KAG0181754.1 Coenzyme Q-binding protein COQ10 B, mitochondrial [Apophysomyces sp. BC1021]KAG0193923.1 Coenzyme Q-binding protein COQ10 B, mitochondrial [Apophysomyces sp. BC1034]